MGAAFITNPIGLHESVIVWPRSRIGALLQALSFTPSALRPHPLMLVPEAAAQLAADLVPTATITIHEQHTAIRDLHGKQRSPSAYLHAIPSSAVQPATCSALPLAPRVPRAGVDISAPPATPQHDRCRLAENGPEPLASHHPRQRMTSACSPLPAYLPIPPTHSGVEPAVLNTARPVRLVLATPPWRYVRARRAGERVILAPRHHPHSTWHPLAVALVGRGIPLVLLRSWRLGRWQTSTLQDPTLNLRELAAAVELCHLLISDRPTLLKLAAALERPAMGLTSWPTPANASKIASQIEPYTTILDARGHRWF